MKKTLLTLLMLVVTTHAIAAGITKKKCIALGRPNVYLLDNGKYQSVVSDNAYIKATLLPSGQTAKFSYSRDTGKYMALFKKINNDEMVLINGSYYNCIAM